MSMFLHGANDNPVRMPTSAAEWLGLLAAFEGEEKANQIGAAAVEFSKFALKHSAGKFEALLRWVTDCSLEKEPDSINLTAHTYAAVAREWREQYRSADLGGEG